MKIIGAPSLADRQWNWFKEAAPVPRLPVRAAGFTVGKDPDELASLADQVDARTPASDLDELEAALVQAFDGADNAGDVDQMQHLAEAIDKVRAIPGADGTVAPLFGRRTP